MKFIVAWLVAITSPSYPEYSYVSIMFNDKQECIVYKEKFEEVAKKSGNLLGLEATCQEVAVMAPIKNG